MKLEYFLFSAENARKLVFSYSARCQRYMIKLEPIDQDN